MFNKTVITSILVLIAGNSIAGEWSSTTNIDWLYPTTTGLIFATKDYSNTDYSSCDNGRRYFISTSHANYETLSSSMMAAFMANRKVKVNIDVPPQPSCSPTINRAIIYSN
ncbi:hypothetical protein [Alteromonas sp. ASW11-130]|uniref:hypothetical protein n=1 Tax=Alteromonas sp. ASW11-130 TaxID=3015775 RepID=UPI0022419CCE|nr:hypothetical protein [Alteromonas sp. ASW11-130]MCW8091129.1 hypothetical protein [Alteromonas sp. ASW11-130]